MCGIAGIIDLSGAPVDPGSLERLTDALAHRGPDGRGLFIRAHVGLGHRRLKVLDLSEAAGQPMVSDNAQIALVFNGEIYNFRELRKELEARGHAFRSTGDTEVLLKAYEEYGEDCLPKLRGMFAFAIFDARRGTVFLARDRLGKKPLKYFRSAGVFAFASELKALRTLSQCPRGMSEDAIHHFLTMMYVPAPETGFDGIKKLPAAHSLTIDLATGEERMRRYWELSYETNRSRTLREWEQVVGDSFREAVKIRMEADVPVGAFLSGGIDSAAVVAAMSGLSPRPVETFTIGTGEATHNELPQAEIIAKRFGTNHHPILVQPDILGLLPELVAAYEEPFADPSVIPTYLVARETRKYVTVALNGDGGDENFAGYVRYPILKFSQLWSALPVHAAARPLVRLFHRFCRSTLSYRSLRFQESIGRPVGERHLQYLSFFTEEEKRLLYRSGFAEDAEDTFAWYASLTARVRGSAPDPLHGALAADIGTYLADDLLPKVDLGSMAHGLEARSPFLDHILLELTATMPPELKLRGFQKKWFLRSMLRHDLPKEILSKRKTGFRLPLDHWFRGELKNDVLGRLLDTSSPLRRVFDPAALEAYLLAYYASRIDLSDHVWSLLWLDEWMRQYTD